MEGEMVRGRDGWRERLMEGEMDGGRYRLGRDGGGRDRGRWRE